MSLYTGGGESFAKKPRKQRKSQDLKQISVLVPKEFDLKKRELGVSWRVLIARGLQGSDTAELKSQVEYFVSRAEKLHQENLELKRRVFKIENR